jgi:hypothetical protein
VRGTSFVAVAALCGTAAACGGASPLSSSSSHSVSGVVTQSGGGALAGVTVTATATGQSVTTGASGAYQLPTAGPTSIQLAKGGYEPETYGEFPMTRDTTVNGVLQPMLRLAAPGVVTSTLFPDDNAYPMAGGASLTMCGPCKVIHIDASAATDLDVQLRWSSPVSLTVWGFGRSASGNSPLRVAARAAAGDNRLYVGVAVGLSSIGGQVAFEITATPIGSP